MSSPTARLRKIKRSPLPETRRVPFRQADNPRDSADVRQLASEFEGDVQCGTNGRPSILEGIGSSSPGRAAALHCHDSHFLQRRRGRRTRKEEEANVRGLSSSPSSDSDLLGSMAARLALVERELLTAKREIIEKDSVIRDLEERLSLLATPPLPPSTHQLEKRCNALQKQVEEMEEFLSDYGMMWVGGDGDQPREASGHKEGVWLPDSSVPNTRRQITVDFDLLVKNVKSLNILAGEGSTAITSTPRGAKLKCLDAVPLTVYANGIVMFQGPFRPFTDPATQQFIQDLQDGYFPSELQSQYPEGVPFQLSDKREVTFVPRGSGQIFPGSGQILGGQNGPSKLCSNPPISSSLTTSELPGPKLSTEQFLSRLPAQVVRAGRVLGIRSEISDVLRGSPVSTDTSVRLPQSTYITTSVPSLTITTLKIRSESDVWSHLLRENTHSGKTGMAGPHLTRLGYQLVSGVTHQVYSDPGATLLECGLTPNATLHITKSSSHTPTHTLTTAIT